MAGSLEAGAPPSILWPAAAAGLPAPPRRGRERAHVLPRQEGGQRAERLPGFPVPRFSRFAQRGRRHRAGCCLRFPVRL